MAGLETLRRLGGPDAGGHHSAGEAGAFFVGPVYGGEGVVCLDVVFVEDAEDFEGRHDAKYAIVSSAWRLSVYGNAGGNI